MTMQSVLAHLPGFLTGPAGKALRPIEHVAESAAAHRPALEGLADGVLTAQRADDLFLGVADDLSLDSAWNGIKAARPALNEALGLERGTKVAQSIHDVLSDLRSPIVKAKVADRYAEEAKLVADGSRDSAASVARIEADAWAEVGGSSARYLQEDMLDKLAPELAQVAARTAATRLAIGAVGVGGAALGARALLGRDAEPVEDTEPAVEFPVSPFAPFPQAPTTEPTVANATSIVSP